jgi:predicted GTPase
MNNEGKNTINTPYDIIKQLAGELHDLQMKYEQSEADREKYMTWWLEGHRKIETLEKQLEEKVEA